ncbi:MAE_28990/MAE_18760 family HEPN-like nuclease [Pseudomonas leptonychotis]|uniref:MAE_28990/MAE_18760 family HEPN-like nuclease n=1 Tax=Pseudomonas leptonychotis TaxID=2448482 RepID=UPI0038648847
MATFLQDFLLTLEGKWKEVDTLIINAKQNKDTDLELYNAICRSTTVLIVAHLEGFTKDLVKSIINDLNRFSSFQSLPKAIQRTYCSKYLGSPEGDKGYQGKIDTLATKFSAIDCKISHEPFFYSKNKNPTSNTIELAFSNFGITKVFGHLYESEIESVFSASPSEALELSEKIKRLAIESTNEFPYPTTSNDLNLTKKNPKHKTLWEEFLEQINLKRHAIAHGNEYDNIDDVTELESRRVKVSVLQYSLATIMANHLQNHEQPPLAPTIL